LQRTSRQCPFWSGNGPNWTFGSGTQSVIKNAEMTDGRHQSRYGKLLAQLCAA